MYALIWKGNCKYVVFSSGYWIKERKFVHVFEKWTTYLPITGMYWQWEKKWNCLKPIVFHPFFFYFLLDPFKLVPCGLTKWTARVPVHPIRNNTSFHIYTHRTLIHSPGSQSVKFLCNNTALFIYMPEKIFYFRPSSPNEPIFLFTQSNCMKCGTYFCQL